LVSNCARLTIPTVRYKKGDFERSIAHRDFTGARVALSYERQPSQRAGLFEPMLGLVVAKLPKGPEWMYELKFDGYRAFGLKLDGRTQLLPRNGKTLQRGLH
jgi:ATP-dependent DNA ligase